MQEITNSQEWVYHDRGGKEPGLIRKFQKVAWDLLFSKKKDKDIIHDLNNKYLPTNLKLFVYDANNPEESLHILKEMLFSTDYRIEISVKV